MLPAPSDWVEEEVDRHGERSARRQLAFYAFLHDLPCWRTPTVVGPECNGCRAFTKNENVALRNVRTRQPGKAMFNEASPNTAPAMRGGDRQMMEVSSSAIVAAKHGPHELATRRFRNRAQAGVAPEKGCDTVLRVGFAKADAFASFPKRPHALVISDIHCTNAERDIVARFTVLGHTPRLLIRWLFSTHVRSSTKRRRKTGTKRETSVFPPA